MKQLHITLNEEMVRKLILGAGREEVFTTILETVLNQLLESKAEDMCGASPYEQTDGRTDYRNGYRDKTLITRIGKITLAVPRLRNQSLLDCGMFARYKRSEQALILGVAEMVVNGISTRKISKVAETMFGESISKSQVSRLCKELDPVVDEFRTRELDSWYPFVLVDAMYIKVRESGKYISKALYIALGINAEGRQEVLGCTIAREETERLYTDFFKSLKERGLERVDYVVSDSHSGLVKAINTVFLGATWQRCQTHFSRNMKDAAPKKIWPEVKSRLAEIYNAKDVGNARMRKDEMLEYLRGQGAGKAVDLLDEAFDDITAVFSLPAKYRRKLRTSNGIERVNEEVRRRERAIRHFPSDESALRILGSVLVELNEHWQTSKRYIDMGEYYEHLELDPAGRDSVNEAA